LAGSGLLILCFSRVVWLAGFLIGLVFLFLKIKQSKLDFSFLAAISFLPLILYLFTKTTIDPSSFWRRQELAVFALKSVKASPLLGVGAGNFTIALASTTKSWDWLYWLQPVHNIFLLAFSEVGLIAVGLFLIIFMAIERNILFLKACSGRSRLEKGPVFGLLAALLAVLITGFFDHYWLTLIQNQLLFVLIISLSLARSVVKLSHD
jgi:O-antigen ligase